MNELSQTNDFLVSKIQFSKASDKADFAFQIANCARYATHKYRMTKSIEHRLTVEMEEQRDRVHRDAHLAFVEKHLNQLPVAGVYTLNAAQFDGLHFTCSNEF